MFESQDNTKFGHSSGNHDFGSGSFSGMSWNKKSALMVFLSVFIIVLVLVLLLIPVTIKREKIQVHYIAIEEIEWQYLPLGKNMCKDMFDYKMEGTLDKNADLFAGETKTAKFKKAKFVEYLDSDFAQKKPIDEDEDYMGLLGPTLRAEVGETLKIYWKNTLSKEVVVIPHGVSFAETPISPNVVTVQEWKVHEQSGPGTEDTSTIPWHYHARDKEQMNAGLFGVIIIGHEGATTKDGEPYDVDKEIVSVFSVLNETLVQGSGLFGQPEITNPSKTKFTTFYNVNGYIYCNNPKMPRTKVETAVRWYLISLVPEVDISTILFEDETVEFEGHRHDSVHIFPDTALAVDMRMDNVGEWLYYDDQVSLKSKGMLAMFSVE